MGNFTYKFKTKKNLWKAFEINNAFQRFFFKLIQWNVEYLVYKKNDILKKQF